MPLIDESALIDGFYDPPEPRQNPLSDDAENEVVDWLWRIGMVTSDAQEKHLRSFAYGRYHALSTPTLAFTGLVTGMMWFCWGSLADDQYDNYTGPDSSDRLRRTVGELTEIMRRDEPISPTRLTNPVTRGFADLWARLVVDLPAAGRRRIGRHFADYMHGIAIQNGYHVRGRIPDLATFVPLRRNTIAMVFQADVSAAIGGYAIDEHVWRCHSLRSAVLAFADVLAWHNDIYGLEKDIADGQTCNIVRVLARDRGISLAEATDLALALAKERQAAFLSHERRLPASARALAQDMRAYAYANVVWVRETRRYDLDIPRIDGTFDDKIGTAV